MKVNVLLTTIVCLSASLCLRAQTLEIVNENQKQVDIRVYAEGQNLFTLSQLTKFNIDPEQPGVQNGYYPQQRVFSMGVTFTF